MKTHKNITIIIAYMLLASAFASACGGINFVKSGEMETESHSVDLGEANSAQVQIEMDIGTLNIDSSEGKLMEGTFVYNVSEWQPQVSYQVNGSQGILLVNQPNQDLGNFPRDGENTWSLRLGESVPMELDINVGAGDSKIDLRRIELTHLTIDNDVGDLDLDLRGSWNHDLDVVIHSRVGNITVTLPHNMGVHVDEHIDIGQVKTDGLSKDGNTYVNDAFGASDHTLYVNVDAELGDIDLQVR